MSHGIALSAELEKPDYSLTGVNAGLAIERGLAEADWYQCHVARDTMRELLQRKDGPAIRDTLLWFGLIFAAAYATYLLRHSAWFVLPYFVYCVLYASTSDSRWHESGHGTAFKTDWMNNALYEIASFMVMRESTVWRWSHNRHHSDTIVVGRDPEIAVPRPPDVKSLMLSFLNLGVYPKYFRQIVMHAASHAFAEEKTYIPATEFPKMFTRAQIYVAIYATVILSSVVFHSVIPLLLVGLPNLFGTWLLVTYGLTQHTGLAENVLDHRLNCRTVYMNPIHRFLYWNMNYHIEHHMYPLVPYHALPRLHAVVKHDCPTPYPSLLSAWREIIPTVMRQRLDPAYHVRRTLPPPQEGAKEKTYSSGAIPDTEGWVSVCPVSALRREDIVRFDHGSKTFAVYRDAEANLYASEGVCTHGNIHLAGGLIVGTMVECPKHNGRFHLEDGSPARAPVCRGLITYPVVERNGELLLNLAKRAGVGARTAKPFQFRVVSNRSVATFIKELLLEPVDAAQRIEFTPGDYLQFDIPAYDQICFRDMDIPEPFATVWRNQHVFDLIATNPNADRRNNYSLASNQRTESTLRFNIRIATPPPGQECGPGVGSSYMFSLKTGDLVSAIGPFGDFHVKPTQRELIYIGGGAGMAPLRAQLSHLLETENTRRKVSFWYGARSRQEIFYEDYFAKLSDRCRNFTFHLALSAPLPGDEWNGPTGFIHEVVLEQYLSGHPNPMVAEYYLCGPPMMIKACTRMLTALGVPVRQIAFDEF